MCKIDSNCSYLGRLKKYLNIHRLLLRATAFFHGKLVEIAENREQYVDSPGPGLKKTLMRRELFGWQFVTPQLN
jgi:hypothetical protein